MEKKKFKLFLEACLWWKAAKVIKIELEFSMFPPILRKVTVSFCHTRVETQPHVKLLYTGSEGGGHQEDHDQSRSQG